MAKHVIRNGKIHKGRQPNKRKQETDDIEYRKWTAAVRKRDGNRCQMPGCTHPNTNRLQTHHIQMWAHAPYLRYQVMNGISLCVTCHKKIRGSESHWMATFTRIVGENMAAAARKDRENNG